LQFKTTIYFFETYTQNPENELPSIALSLVTKGNYGDEGTSALSSFSEMKNHGFIVRSFYSRGFFQ
jgi:hypothetical protein